MTHRPRELLQMIALGALVGCAGPMPEDAEAEGPSGKPPVGKPSPQGAPAVPDESLLPPPPEDLAPPPPREEGCGDLPIEGACEGSTAVWCEGGQRRAVDCAEVGRVCEFLGDESGFYCGGYRAGEEPPPEAEPDPLPPPPEGEPEGEAPPPGEPPPPAEEPEAAPPNGPQPEAEPEGAPPPPEPDAEPEGAPDPPEGGEPEAAPAPPGEGEPEPEGAPAPPVPDPEQGEGAPPPPGGAPPPEDVPAEGMACGDLSYHGTCAGGVVVYCHEDRVVHHTCPQGETCGWYDDDWGNWCVNE